MMPPRKLYKFSHSIYQGGYLYAHKTSHEGLIRNREQLRDAIEKTTKKLELMDVTIKIYDSIFFLYFMMKPSIAPAKVIDSIQENIKPLDVWHKDYLFTGVYDLQEPYIRKDLERMGFDCEKG